MCRSNSPSFSLGLAVGGRVRLSPFAARPLAAGEPHVRRHSCFSPAVYGTRAGHPSAQHTSLSAIPSKDAEGSPSRWRVPLLPGLLDTQSQVCLPLHDTLIPLSYFLHEWEHLPGVSLWVLRTIRTGYTLQFGKNPPRFDGVHLTVVNSAAKASVLQQELSSLLQKGAIEEVPQSEVERGFFSRYFLVPKRDGGLRPILDLRRLNLSLYKGKFKMLTMRTIMSQVQEGDWFVTIDLKDAYFHIQVVHRHRRFLRFAFGGKAYQYKDSALRPGFGPEDIYQMHGCCTGPFEAPGHPCTELSGRLAHSGSLQGASESSQGYRSRPHPFSWPQDERQEECAPPISTNCISRSSFGFRSDAGPFGSCPDTSFYSMFGPLQARPSCLCRYLPQAVGPYGSSLPCVAPGAFLWWMKELRLHPTVPATRLVRVLRSCCRHLLMWRDPVFLRSGVRMGAIHHRHMITTDASMTGWGAVFEGRPASGEWKEEFLFWHINCLELRAVFLALKYFLPVLGEHHVIVRTDNMAVVSHIPAPWTGLRAIFSFGPKTSSSL